MKGWPYNPLQGRKLTDIWVGVEISNSQRSNNVILLEGLNIKNDSHGSLLETKMVSLKIKSMQTVSNFWRQFWLYFSTTISYETSLFFFALVVTPSKLQTNRQLYGQFMLIIQVPV